MAMVHQKLAGQWAKEKATGLYGRLVVAAAVLIYVMGLGTGVSFALFGWTGGWLGFFLFMLLIIALSRPLFRRMDTWSKERIRFIRGGQAEALVLMYLRDLPDGWHVFNNLPCADGGDIDHVVVGPGGVFVLSTKSYKGHVTRTPQGQVLLNGRPLHDLDEAMRLAMWVRRYLTATLGQQTPWIQPVLTLPLAALTLPATETPVWLLTDTTLLDTLTPENPRPDRKLPAGKVEQIVGELGRLTA